MTFFRLNYCWGGWSLNRGCSRWHRNPHTRRQILSSTKLKTFENLELFMGWRIKAKLIKIFLQLSNVMILAVSPTSNVNVDNHLCEKWYSSFTLYEYSVQTPKLCFSAWSAHVHGPAQRGCSASCWLDTRTTSPPRRTETESLLNGD